MDEHKWTRREVARSLAWVFWPVLSLIAGYIVARGIVWLASLVL